MSTPIIQYAGITQVAASAHFESTDEREYFDGIGTSPTPDAYDRIVSADSMPQIATDFAEGRRILDSHKHETNGIGQTTRGEVIKTIIDSTEHPVVHFSGYILKGLKLDGQTYKSTDDWAKVVKDGMANAWSIGFTSERDICNLCFKPIFRYPCRHYPGEYETITNTETGEEEEVKCTYTCFGCRLVEISFVYYGANPDARLIRKAKALAEDNVFQPQQIERIENRLNVAILETNRSYFDMALSSEDKTEIGGIIAEALKPVVAQIANLEETKTEEPTTAAPSTTTLPILPHEAAVYNITDAQGNVVQQIRGADIPQPPAPLTKEAVADSVKTAIEPLTQRLEKIETAVKSGDPINDRDKAVEENIKQYRRVHGTDVDVTEHTASLETYPDVASIQTVTKALKQTADTMFREGRQTSGLGDELDGGNETDQEQSGANPM